MQIRSVVLAALLAATSILVSPARATAAIKAIGPTFFQACALTTDDQVVCWRPDFFDDSSKLLVTRIDGLPKDLAALTGGAAFNCVRTSAGAVWCWGDNSQGNLGVGTVDRVDTPVAVTGLSSGVTAVASSSMHSCAVTAAAAAVCWGGNFSGELGDGTTERRTTPVSVIGLPNSIVSVAAGVSHSCAVTAAGAVFCWGSNTSGQLGDGTTQQRLTAVPVAGLPGAVLTVAAGYTHTCALLVNRAVTCWGDNAEGQLGDGTTTNRLTPGVVSTLSDVIDLTVGQRHGCAITAARVLCWGYAIANGSTANRLVPTVVDGVPSGALLVAANSHLTCAAVSNGLWCWGTYGIGTRQPSTPIPYNLGPVAIARKTLRFGALSSGGVFTAQSGPQTVRITQSEGAPVTWSASTDQPWLVVSPASGSGPAVLTVTVRHVPGLVDRQTGRVNLSFGGFGNFAGPIDVTLDVAGATAPPFGVVDTPTGSATPVEGSVAIGGWALDDIGVKRVELWRDLQPTETTPPFSGAANDPRSGKVFIANATFVDGARPDIEQLYPASPFAYRGGWGYLLLTWGLWNDGNGTYRLYAYAVDEENNTSLIGSKALVVANSAATKPFGSIDTPGIGGDASGPNFGWALTPKVNGVATCRIPATGVQVSIDSGPLEPVAYGDARTDVAGAFPGFANSAAAGGHFLFDWSTLTNGVHTIGWLVTDDCGRAEGIGSRFFNVSTGTTSAPGVSLQALHAADRRDPIVVRRGREELAEHLVFPEFGARSVEVQPGERLEIRLPRQFATAHLLVAGERRALPIGSTWDGASGTFYWQPAPGFLGPFALVFSNGSEEISVRVLVKP